ncbi:nucleolar protein 4-like [Copidosoma floridanum]|uniref:nucleolar protein 4-like n=1 Tax=Copidosoma floridanum TaxID=29053 RepID=UPI0006C9C17D|nr:nucleolar protein 4-like [Copidosoma floridanum]
MSAKRKATAIMQHHKENISTPEPADISEDDHYSSALMKDADKLKLMLLAWNYSLQQQQVPGSPVQALATQAQQPAPAQQPTVAPTNGPAASPTGTSSPAATGCPSAGGSATSANAGQSVACTGNGTPTESRNGSVEPVGEPVQGAAAVVAASGTPGSVAGEDMASLWASYTMGMKKTPSTPPGPQPPGSGTPSRDRESSPAGGEAGSAHDETSSSGNKEDEDDDDEDVDERLDPRHHDPERLKAFNMFVRLFVDENLDRIVPISKQPKEKIQAIIDSCTRQFPEFAERARKRIRTYLKSCRRNKRGREGAPWDAARPTPAHLTSVQAEQILATACENESDNAKRMRVGLEPVSQPMPTLPAATQTDVRASMDHFASSSSSSPAKALPANKREDTPPASHTSLAPLTSLTSLPSGASLASAPLSLAPTSKLLATDAQKSLMSQATVVSSSTANGIGSAAAAAAPTAMYRPNFSQAFQRAGPTTVPPTLSAGLYPTQSFTSGLLSNGTTQRPTDLSMKNNAKPLLSHKLNATEMTAVRQLITGYRESAAFLLRSADELEQLLHQQP